MDRSRLLSILMLAPALAACDVATLDVTLAGSDSDSIAALDIVVERDGDGRCQRFDGRPVAMPDDHAGPGDHIVVTATDDTGAIIGVADAIMPDGDLRLALTPIERRLTRGATATAYLAASPRHAGRQLAMTDAGATAVVWTDDDHEHDVAGRRIDGPRSSLDRGLIDYPDAGRDQAVVAALGDGFITAWTLGVHGLQAHALDADLEPINPFHDVGISDVTGDDKLYNPHLIGAGDRALAAWIRVGAAGGTRIGVRWLSIANDALVVGASAYLDDGSDEQYAVTGTALASGDVIVAWLDRVAGGSRDDIRLVRVARDGAPAMATAVRLGVSPGRIGSLALAEVGGHLVVAWSMGIDVGASVHVVALDAALAVTGDVIDIGQPGAGTEVALVAVGDGLVAGWTETAPTDASSVWVRWLAGDGTPVGAARSVGLIAGGEQTRLSLASNGALAAAAWQQRAADRDPAIVGRFITADDRTAAPVLCAPAGAGGP